MTHGIRFLQENPEINEVLEKLYLKRELDQWYIEKSKQPIVMPEDILNIQEIIEVKVQDRFNPSAYVYMKLQEHRGEGGFILLQEMQLTISKIVPVYQYLLYHRIKHDSLQGFLGLVGSADTFEFMEVEAKVNKIFQQSGFIKLSHEYDAYDTVYEWSHLENIDPVNRRLTLKDAVFVDILELCND
ncbi:hypothetical protein [Paenibacillus alba]|uniref:Uncharacterized protein n=1 Tax=Paenibacillus alba TaxID=1197127 RepID=A0ABU6FYV5_9BACL|nr:hypothetical protein [Paenibacillus alba]MEC0226227.1 hypothetical protein [Paenibacillus alba]